MHEPPLAEQPKRSVGEELTAPFLPYARILATMLDGVLVVAAPDGRVVIANEAAGRIFGVPRDELLAPVESFIERFDLRSRDGARALPIGVRALQGEVVPPDERLLRTPDGRDKTIRTSAAPLRDDRGEVVAAVIVVGDVTAERAAERRAAEQARALRDKEEHLRLAKEAARLGSWEWNLLTNEHVWSERSRELFGLPPDVPVTHATFLAAVAPEDRERVEAAVRRAIDDGEDLDVELRALWPDGTRHWVASKGRAFFENGRAVRMVGMALDIDERKAAEQALRISEARARAISRNIRDALMVFEAVRAPDGAVIGWRYADANEGGLRLMGAARADLVGRSLREVIPERSAALEQRMERVFATGEPEQYETSFRGLALLVRIFRIDESTLGTAALDITERKRAELRLRESAQRYRAFFENLIELVGVYEAERDEDGNVVALVIRDMNDPALALFGRSRDETVGKPISEVFGPEPARDVLPSWSSVLETGVPVQHELVLKGRTLLFSVARMGADTLAAVAADITERKQAENAMREADRRKTEFLGVLSHELRNPLAPIRNGIHVLERAPSDSRQAVRAREVLRRQTDHLARLVDDLLDVTRISRGKIRLHCAPMDLREVVRRTCEDLRSLFEQSGIELRVDLAAGPIQVDADAARIAQIVGNLLQNANKFTPPSGVVTVTLRLDGGRARLSVRDTGIGIDPSRVAQVFEPFTQEEHGLARTRGGLGLGLALAKGLVTLHGGEIVARSEGVGRGTEFVVTLPLLEPQPEAHPAPAAAPGEPRAATGRLVLIVEDNVDAAEILADLLQLEGHRVHLARDAASGIALARELHPDVVLCDIGLPDADGYAVARALRAEESLRSTRLVALSGYAQPEDKQRAREAGFDAHLSKPASLEALTEALS
ncbi:PAS domain-containing hybrid sensor histidine kinase/response regulator [Anaeromyxobacter oryzisoli]|uniref:PAS domain-containing hybrid sensor histidine kinase/response regulator n=1 Tax=Anaeromyxobacter oryzisoli TaxID=2925408 RepID=UPI001F580F89|nr:PAS domain-containing protein [Anaeromyxobacter sp. SG63]